MNTQNTKELETSQNLTLKKWNVQLVEDGIVNGKTNKNHEMVRAGIYGYFNEENALKFAQELANAMNVIIIMHNLKINFDEKESLLTLSYNVLTEFINPRNASPVPGAEYIHDNFFKVNPDKTYANNVEKIPEGYKISFNTTDLKGENDSLVIKEGLSENKVNLFVELSQVIQDSPCMSNFLEEPKFRVKKAHEKLLHVIHKYNNFFSNEELKNFNDDIGEIVDYIAKNMLGYAAENCGTMRRLVDYKIEYVPKDILLDNVTSIFKNKMH